MIFVIGGVTGSGKTTLALRLAHDFDAIIINADAFAVYKELNIGTAKPTSEELNGVTHYLFDIKKPDESYSIYEFQQSVRQIFEEHSNSKRPLVLVGGSALYIRAALYNYELSKENIPPLDDNPLISNKTLYDELTLLDPLAATKIHMNNRKRVLRALSRIKATNFLKSDEDAKTSDVPLYDYVMVNLDRSKEQMDELINKRVEQMFVRGLKKEALDLEKKYGSNILSLQAIGYKEIINNKELSEKDLIDLVSLKTRQYAKRQRTFFKNKFISQWFFDIDSAYNYMQMKIGEHYGHQTH